MILFKNIDTTLFLAIIPLLSAGLITMYSFVNESYFFGRQIIWISITITVFIFLSKINWRFLRQGWILVYLYGIFTSLLIVLLFIGNTVRGAQSWLLVGGFTFQPSDFMKLVLILMLAKYFSRRHVQIAHIQHIFISGVYALIPFLLILMQPDFGSAIIIFLIWLGMIIVSGVSKKHLISVFVLTSISILLLWVFVFTGNQKDRIVSFIRPLEDIQGAGYNAYQSTIAIGSGGLFGKGIGYGTQSRLQFLPEYQTDFIFAAFAEEWGFIGVIILFILFGIIFWRIIINALHGDTNFEILFGFGLAIMFMSHLIINIGMNMGLLPVTGLTLPFLSYGGSHLLVEFIGLGILMGMRGYARIVHKEKIIESEVVGLLEY